MCDSSDALKKPKRRAYGPASVAGHIFSTAIMIPTGSGSKSSVERMRQDPQAFRSVEDVAQAARVGSSKLSELFRRHYHTTPAEMLCRQRIEQACRNLLAGDRSIAEIAFDVGFESLSAFNENFRRLVRLSPQSYRQLVATDRFEIELPAYFGVDRVLQYLGRDAASVMERVRGRTFVFRQPGR